MNKIVIGDEIEVCGICGYIELKGDKKVDRTFIKGMTETLAHRGPDGTNYYYGNYFTFGFTRLSIIDLKGGMQPLTNEDQSIILICNGEIFNYIELKKSLQIKGHIFKTNCDVEVIIHLYEEYGRNFINYLNGQFAFVLYDKRCESFICARDHFGIAPFYYTIVDGTFIFASEIKAILKHIKVKREVDLVGLDQIFTFPGLIGPQTMFKDIRSLENGYYLYINRDGNVNNIEYWDLRYPEEGEIEYKSNESYYIEELSSRLFESIRLRLRADVPVGLYISGGLDSALISAVVKEINNETQRYTFSIDFEKQNISEEKYQNIVVNHIKSLHSKKCISILDIVNRLQSVIYHCETPLKESYNMASFALSEEVKNKNIKVVLTGEGADELFAGYVGYKFDKIRQLQKNDSLNPSEVEIRQRLWGDGDFFYEKNYYDYRKTKKSIYSDNIKDIYDSIDCLNYPIIKKDRLYNRDIIHKRSYLDYKLRIVDHLVSDHGDRMTYANSVEARYPFLDKDLVEFVRMMPPHLKLNNFNEKYALKKVAKGLVPKEIIDREKFAFVAPGSNDMLKINNDYFQSLLSQDTIKKQGFFNPTIVEELRKKYLSQEFNLNLPYESDMLIILITFGIFLDTFNLSNLS